MTRRTSQNSWEIEYASSYVERNEDTEVVATKEGIDVHGSFIPWAEIDEAKEAVTVCNTRGRDLGTYHLRVSFTNARTIITRIHTGARYSHGRSSSHPETATRISPVWDSESALIQCLVFQWTENNNDCDCNRKAMISDAYQEPAEDFECGDILKLKQLDLIRPNGSEVTIFTSPS